MNKSSRHNFLNNFLQIGKFSVILPVSLTAFTGFFLYDPGINLKIFLVTLGVFLQGTAASGLNQIQEKVIDSRMPRTKDRPIPTGRIHLHQAITFVIISFIAGSAALYSGGNLTALLLGIFTILWYNGIYTILKKQTAFAVIPGALTGAIPPLIGWTAAGGNPDDLTAVLLAFIFFMGQVPHFWLLIMKYGEEYKEAGLPSLTNIFSIRQINNLSFMWICASLVSSMMLAYFGILESPIVRIILVLITIAGIIMFVKLINNEDSVGRKKYFIELNVYYFILIILLLSDKIAS